MSNDILTQLKAATRGLRYVSESDRPVKPFLWTADKVGAGITDAETALRATEQIKPETPIKIKTLAEFFAPMLNEYPGQPDEEKETVKRFRELQELLSRLLTEPKAFRVGDGTDIPAYVVGKTTTGDWAGVETVLVET